MVLQLCSVKMWIYWNFKTRDWCFPHCFIPPYDIYWKYLCSLSEVNSMESVMDTVVKITQCMHSNAVNHHQFMERNRKQWIWWSCFLIYVHGLSHGRVLQRFTVLSIPIQDLLEREEILTKYLTIKDLKNSSMIYVFLLIS